MNAPDTLVEKMARADAEFCRRDFDALGRADKRRFLDRAAFMLDAMREPTEAMEKSADGIAYSQRYGRTNAVWRAMIDAAIQEHSTPPRNAS